MKTPLKIGLVSALALATALPAYAQYTTPQYERDVQNYEAQRETWRDRQDDYDSTRADYDAQRAAYERRRDDYERARIDYDARYGVGAYARRYGPAPVYTAVVVDSSARADFERRRDDYERARAAYDRRNGYGAYARRYGPAPVWAADAYGRDTAYIATDACRGRASSNAVAGGLIGAIAGAALGSNVAARNARTEGAVLGGILGGALGANIGKASAKCDDSGYYFSYNETVPYRESTYDRRARSGQYDYSYYVDRRCRLAPAPVDWGDRTEYRYVRVCPDAAGRYRVTG